MDEYLDTINMECVSAVDIRVRKLEGEELTNSGHDYAYIIEEGRSSSVCGSDMELLVRFIHSTLHGKTAPINLSLDFDIDGEKYPWNDPKYGLETVIGNHNRQAMRSHIEIGDVSPFYPNFPPRRITKEKATELIAEAGK